MGLLDPPESRATYNMTALRIHNCCWLTFKPTCKEGDKKAEEIRRWGKLRGKEPRKGSQKKKWKKNEQREAANEEEWR